MIRRDYKNRFQGLEVPRGRSLLIIAASLVVGLFGGLAIAFPGSLPGEVQNATVAGVVLIIAAAAQLLAGLFGGGIRE